MNFKERGNDTILSYGLGDASLKRSGHTHLTDIAQGIFRPINGF
jgi:hypothetical protein